MSNSSLRSQSDHISTERYANFKLEIDKNHAVIDGSSHKARCGRIHTPHGSVETPNFIFCATKAAIKGGVPAAMLKDMGTGIILSNTYHLMLQPGGDVVEKLGGLHKMLGFDGPMLTDSGGYQVFSMGYGSVSNEIKRSGNMVGKKSLMKITEEGAHFRSYTDGSRILLTPEKSYDVQRQLGADFIVTFDECTAYRNDERYTAASMRRSHRWALRFLAAFDENDVGQQAIYNVIQGGVFENLRRESIEFSNENDFFAHAVGGCLGKDKQEMYDIVSFSMDLLDTTSKPVHLLGIGGVRDIFHGVRQGIDTFDCVSPTRIARHGVALLAPNADTAEPYKEINLRNSRFKGLDKPIDENCDCMACKNYSTGTIHHLFKAKEALGPYLVSVHNITFMNKMMHSIRTAIADDDIKALNKLEKQWVGENYGIIC